MKKDPSQDIYALFDEAGLGISKLSSRRPLSLIINEIRTGLAVLLKSYIQARDQKMIEVGYNKRKEEESAAQTDRG